MKNHLNFYSSKENIRSAGEKVRLNTNTLEWENTSFTSVMSGNPLVQTHTEIFGKTHNHTCRLIKYLTARRPWHWPGYANTHVTIDRYFYINPIGMVPLAACIPFSILRVSAMPFRRYPKSMMMTTLFIQHFRINKLSKQTTCTTTIQPTNRRPANKLANACVLAAVVVNGNSAVDDYDDDKIKNHLKTNKGETTPKSATQKIIGKQK